MASSLTNQTSGDAMGSETFAALWAALQNTYEGTNITRTVARLLHMYQPEDGILAYERLLRTLYVLLEDFDANGFRLLVSMVPPPKDISESTIQEIFQKATGFTRMTSPDPQTHFVDSAKEVGSNGQINNMKVDPNQKDTQCSRSFPSNQGKGSEKFNESPQTISPDPVEFRGFPSNEICNTHIRVQNINQFYEPTSVNYVSQAYHTCNHNTNHQTSGKIQDKQNPNSSIDYRMKWIYTPYLLRKNAICQSTQFYQDPLVIFQTADQKHLGIPMSQINQLQRGDHNCTTQECLRNLKKPTVIDLLKDQEKMDLDPETNSKSMHLQGNNNNSSEEMKKRNLSFEMKVQEKKLNEQKTNVLEEEVKLIQRAIQEDIYKMDVVQTNLVQSNPTVTPETKNLEPKDLDVHNDLRQSVQKFLQRVKNEETASATVVPKPKVSNRPTENTVSDETSAFIDCWKKIITRSVLGRDTKSSSTDADKNPGLSKEKTGTLIENGSGEKKETEKKVRRKKPNPPTRPKSERVAQRTPNQTQMVEMGNQSSSSRNSTKRMNNSSSNKELALEEPSLRSQTKRCELNSINMLQQANSMSELATYKKQYYDALLSIQRAKVAVANSLAISSVGSTTGYDPYYFNYLQRQHQLIHQQRFLMGTQFSTQRPLQPVVSNNQNAQNSWANSNDWRYPSFEQFRIPRHSHPVYSSPINPATSNFLAQETATGEVRQCGENHCDQSRPNVKRKKLEEIVGKLKEPENVSTQHSTPH